MKGLRKALSLILALVMVFQVMSLTVFADKSGTGNSEPDYLPYEQFTMLGDSISLGYVFESGYYSYTDIKENKKYTQEDDTYETMYYSYPMLLGEKLGLTRKYINNDSICAATSVNIKNLLEDFASNEHGVEHGFFEDFVGIDGIKEDIESSDLVGVAVGGNDILQGLMKIFFGENSTPADRFLGIIMFTSMFDVTYIDKTIPYAVLLSDEKVFDSVTNAENPESLKWAELLGSVDILQNFIDSIGTLKHYTPEALSKAMEPAVEEYRNALEPIFRYINTINNKAQIVAVPQFNAYGYINYLNMLDLEAQSGELLDKYRSNKDVMQKLLNAFFYGTRTMDYIMDLIYRNQITDATAETIAGITSVLSAIKHKPELEAGLADLFTDIIYPLLVVTMGNGLMDVYDDMDAALRDAVNNCNNSKNPYVTYVDISGAPSSGNFDPHPTTLGHKWIADRIYEQVIPTVTAGCTKGGCFTDEDGKPLTIFDKNGYFTTEFKLNSEPIYYFKADPKHKIQKVYVDGRLVWGFEDNLKLTNTDCEIFGGTEAGLGGCGSYTFDPLRGGYDYYLNNLHEHTLYVVFDNALDEFIEYNVFDKLAHPVTVLYDERYGKAGLVSVGDALARDGEEVTLYAEAEQGFELDKWIVFVGSDIDTPTETDEDGIYEFTMGTERVIIKALFKESDSSPIKSLFRHKVTVEQDEGGKIKTSLLDKYAFKRERIELYFTPEDEYDFVGFTLDFGTESKEYEKKDCKLMPVTSLLKGEKTYTYTFTMPSKDVTVTPNFKNMHPYSVEVAVGVEGGFGEVNVPNVALEGDTVTFTATPEPGYHFKEWQIITDTLVPKVINDEKTEFEIGKSNVYAIPVFEKNEPVPTYSVTALTYGKGTTTASVKNNLETGAEVILKAVPAKDWVFDGWIITSGGIIEDDIKLKEGTDNTYTFEMKNQDVIITAKYIEKSKIKHEVSTYGVRYGDSVASVKSGVPGTEVTLTATPKDGYELKEWKVVYGDVKVEDNKFTIGDEDVLVKAIFQKAQPKPEEPEQPEEENPTTGAPVVNTFAGIAVLAAGAWITTRKHF